MAKSARAPAAGLSISREIRPESQRTPGRLCPSGRAATACRTECGAPALGSSSLAGSTQSAPTPPHPSAGPPTTRV